MSQGPWGFEVEPPEPVLLVLLVDPEVPLLLALSLPLLDEPLLEVAEVLFRSTTAPAVVGLAVCGETVSVSPPPETQYE